MVGRFYIIRIGNIFQDDIISLNVENEMTLNKLLKY
jgi:hypothetical protein